MMNWNNNDTKYIIKRFILYLLITGIVFFAGSKCAKAQVGSNYINYPSNPRIVDFQQGQNSRSYTITNTAGNPYEIWGGLSQGYVIFTAATSNGTQGVLTSQLMSIDIASDTRTFHCEMGTIATYIDNTTEMNVYSVKCPVDFSDNHGWKYIIFERNNKYNLLYVHISNVATYVSDVSEAASITSSQQQAANQQITAIQNQALETRAHIDDAANNIVNATQNASSQAHQDAQNIVSGLQQANATQQATQDYLKEDYQFDQQMINDFGIFGTNTNYLQQILMWPYNLALSLGTALSGTSCSTYSFGYLYGTELTLPCINWKQYVGNTIYVAIDTIMGMCLLFGVISFIRKAFEYVLNFGNSAYETISVEVFK